MFEIVTPSSFKVSIRWKKGKMLSSLGDFIERAAGQKIIMLSLLGFSVLMFKSGLEKMAETLFTFTLGALTYAMKPGAVALQSVTTSTPTLTTTATTGEAK